MSYTNLFHVFIYVYLLGPPLRLKDWHQCKESVMITQPTLPRRPTTGVPEQIELPDYMKMEIKRKLPKYGVVPSDDDYKAWLPVWCRFIPKYCAYSHYKPENTWGVLDLTPQT